MVTPEGPAQAHHYGFGIATGALRGQPMLSHGGGIHGFISTLNYLPKTQTTVVILRNSDSPGFSMDLVARKLAAFAMGEPFTEPQPVAVPAEQLRAAEGVYAGPDQRQCTLRVKADALQAQCSGGGVMPLLPLGSDRFAMAGSLTEITLERGAEGRVVAARMADNGETGGPRWVRSGDLPPDRSFIPLTAEQMQALVGQYQSPQFALQVFIGPDGKLLGQAPGQPAFELQASTARRVHVPQVDAQLDFSPEAGRATAVTLRQGAATLEMPRKE